MDMIFLKQIEGSAALQVFTSLNQFAQSKQIDALCVMGFQHERGLIQACRKRAFDRGHERLWVRVLAGNKRALDFLSSCGFSPIRDEPLVGKSSQSGKHSLARVVTFVGELR